MKKFITTVFLAMLSQQALAVSTVVGIDFLDIANTVSTSVGSFATNDPTQATPVNSAVDGNAASYTYGLSDPSTLDVLLGDGAVDAATVNLTMLFVGSNPHTGSLSLFGGTGGTSSVFDFSLTPYDAGPPEVFTGYTGYNSVLVTEPTEEGGEPSTETLGIFALTINLADAFPGFTGTFNGASLQIYGGGYDSGLALVGTTAVPVPAAVWLFGSGLIGLVGIARRKK